MKIDNRRARFDFEISEKYEAGMALTGGEVKSLKMGRAQLEGAYVVIRASGARGLPEAWLVNANIPTYEHARVEESDPKRTRKLLLHRRELFSLEQKMKEGRLTIVPLVIYTTGRLVKLSIGLGRGRKAWQKRELLKKRDLKREAEAELGGRARRVN
ncbi:MAG: SsrA-binding protein [Candidatus Nomurabacteria bacterium GW2011_GWA1_46_11]|uniref:SsrA-binding protein n=1 Tax=Candidatus Nomurabacteria bacterium GW2011_GWA1_46_11 TaxID=1618732 RepID=A0A0G1QVF1_9BACT|nr:MAG: SsrA-binding protein [Microgenomates group bacterium GW2011_GWA2_44_7]KKT77958.1 MAG: SsrA-binding protein [Microgenomates group bacterium GW2011_GWB1_44_8]KKU21783.1 MAG: SsrA-binding protein [Candidatus Nomurabacteria bacterium GW2011_GWA1_46_11]